MATLVNYTCKSVIKLAPVVALDEQLMLQRLHETNLPTHVHLCTNP